MARTDWHGVSDLNVAREKVGPGVDVAHVEPAQSPTSEVLRAKR